MALLETLGALMQGMGAIGGATTGLMSAFREDPAAKRARHEWGRMKPEAERIMEKLYYNPAAEAARPPYGSPPLYETPWGNMPINGDDWGGGGESSAWHDFAAPPFMDETIEGLNSAFGDAGGFLGGSGPPLVRQPLTQDLMDSLLSGQGFQSTTGAPEVAAGAQVTPIPGAQGPTSPIVLAAAMEGEGQDPQFSNTTDMTSMPSPYPFPMAGEGDVYRWDPNLSMRNLQSYYLNRNYGIPDNVASAMAAQAAAPLKTPSVLGMTPGQAGRAARVDPMALAESRLMGAAPGLQDVSSRLGGAGRLATFNLWRARQLQNLLG